MKTSWEVAESLTGEAKDFAQFAAETQADQHQFSDANYFDADLLNRYNERVAIDYKMTKYEWQDSHIGIPATGGLLVRAIDSTSAEDGHVITLCEFNTPGVFDVVNGNLRLEDKRVFSATSITVKSTTKPSAADSHTSKAPRLLVVSLGSPDNQQDAESRCDKFAPEPFIQTTPSPTHPTSQPK